VNRNLVLATLMTLLAFGFSEAVIRVWVERPRVAAKVLKGWALVPERVWTTYHPVLGWYHQKGKKAILTKNGLEVEINTNSQGFRGRREYQENKPQEIIRIVTLGDSFAFGFGVEDNETFSSILEERYDNLEVINLGVAGYGIDQMYLSFQSIGAKFHPDYVLVAIYPEDFWRATKAFSDAGHAKPYFSILNDGKFILNNVPVPEHVDLNQDQFPVLVHHGAIERILAQCAIYRQGKRAVLRLLKELDWIDPDTTQEWMVGRTILHQLVQEIRSSGALPIILLVPSESWVRDSRPTSLHKSLARFSRRKKVSLLDLTSTFGKAAHRSNLDDFYIESDGHWSVKGHQLAADAINQYLHQHYQFLARGEM